MMKLIIEINLDNDAFVGNYRFTFSAVPVRLILQQRRNYHDEINH